MGDKIQVHAEVPQFQRVSNLRESAVVGHSCCEYLQIGAYATKVLFNCYEQV
jgi:hypothetical protein